MKTKYATQSKWAGIVFVGSLTAIIWQFTHGAYQVNLYMAHDYSNMALIGTCVGSYWYACWSYGCAKGYPVLSALLPLLSFFGLAVLLFLQDQDSMPESLALAIPARERSDG